MSDTQNANWINPKSSEIEISIGVYLEFESSIMFGLNIELIFCADFDKETLQMRLFSRL